MAGKKVPTFNDAIKYFKEVMQRASLSDYFYVGNIIISKNNKNNHVILELDEPLLIHLINEDEDMKGHMYKLDINEDSVMSMIYEEYKKIDNKKWIELNSEEIYNGNLIKVGDGINLEYEIMIGKSLLPLKLKKAEFNQISYQFISDKDLFELFLIKRFSPIVEGTEFSITRLFKIL